MIKLLSSDLNGTLVHQHTMSDMVRLYIGKESFRKADSVFKKQANGIATMEEAFATVGPLTRGLTLRQAIDYTRTHMKYIDGFNEFIDALHNAGIPLVINSTGYSIIIYSIREQVGKDKIQGQICNFLKFGENGNPNSTLREDELKILVAKYFANPEFSKDIIYDRIQATGVVELGIQDEAAKAKLVLDYAKKYFPEVKPNQIAHIGDTIGDSEGIFNIAKQGGLGIAFNYNEALERFLLGKLKTETIKGSIVFVEVKSASSNLMRVVPYLLEKSTSQTF